MKSGTLSIIATPIGNLGDWSHRAVEVASQADVIACEDTRTSRTLMQHYGINTPLIAYHEHSSDKAHEAMLERLAGGEHVALISDAGTPLISDPGYKLVREAQEVGIVVEAIPGASSVTAALSISGLPTNKFLFLGFLPNKKVARTKELSVYKTLDATLVCLESPKRIAAMLADAHAALGEREAVIAREITKKFEETLRGTLSELMERLQDNPIKGEIVVMIAPPIAQDAPSEKELTTRLTDAFALHRTRDAVKLVSEETGVSKKLLYDLALTLKGSE